MTTTIRTLIVDDDFQVASIHADYVDRVDNFTVAGVAHTAAAAAAAVQQLHPDLILLDLYLPDEGGLSLLARLRDGPGPHPDVTGGAAIFGPTTPDLRRWSLRCRRSAKP